MSGNQEWSDAINELYGVPDENLTFDLSPDPQEIIPADETDSRQLDHEESDDMLEDMASLNDLMESTGLMYPPTPPAQEGIWPPEPMKPPNRNISGEHTLTKAIKMAERIAPGHTAAWSRLWMLATMDKAYTQLNKMLSQMASTYVHWAVPLDEYSPEYLADLMAVYELAFWFARLGRPERWTEVALLEVVFYGNDVDNLLGLDNYQIVFQTVHAGFNDAHRRGNLTRTEW